ncbi:helix-turn-helix domain-containing protein [Parvularcula marina]|uniref:helix-turn-helix domain-containing protein n=1 Tax=Parvularcula marina TaxID=2292771 RepID=UPI003515C566
MEPHDFKKWRKSLGYSQKDAADALGLKRRMIQYYEKGERDGENVHIPLSVALACYALSVGVTNYRGPSKKVDRAEDGKDAKDVKEVKDPKDEKDGKEDKDAA